MAAKFAIEESTIIDILVSQNRCRADQIQQVILSKPPLAGDNFGSVVVAITTKLTSGENIKLFAKTLGTNEKCAKDFEDMEIFVNEQVYFSGLLPIFKDYFSAQVAAGKFSFDFLPEFLHADSKLILLEDLTPRGYVMRSKLVKHKEAELRTVSDSLARFHALSYVYLQNEGSKDAILKKYPSLGENAFSAVKTEPMLRPMFENGVRDMKTILEKRLCDGCDQALEILERRLSRPYEIVVKNNTDDPSETKFLAICHGDVWNNNMMFNPAGDHAILLDLQTVHMGSLVRDIDRYVYCSMDPAERLGNGWRNCLNIYFDRFCHYVHVLGGKVQFSFSELEQEFIRWSPFGFLLAMISIVMMPAIAQLTSPDEAEGGFTEQMTNATERWLKNNPDQAESLSQEAIQLLQEFEALHS